MVEQNVNAVATAYPGKSTTLNPIVTQDIPPVQAHRGTVFAHLPLSPDFFEFMGGRPHLAAENRPADRG
ncbi:hypothetical protein ACIBO5_46635 [Nonomuraea angiospora]|uniref:hypothetical protein n=1 Tax=Nonomuraea angiospora TaxID=46172 RepID=UPI003797F676